MNDALDDAVKQTRRSMGRKIRKEVLVSLAIEAMLKKVEAAGGWSAIASEEELRELLGLNIGLTVLANSENTYAGLASEDDETIESFLGSFISRRLLT